MTFFEKRPFGLLLRVFVQPRSAKNQVVGVHGDSLKIRLTAPPVGGAANAMCLSFLSKFLDIPKSSLSIVSGQTSRNKQVKISLGDSGACEREINRLLALFQAMQ